MTALFVLGNLACVSAGSTRPTAMEASEIPDYALQILKDEIEDRRSDGISMRGGTKPELLSEEPRIDAPSSTDANGSARRCKLSLQNYSSVPVRIFVDGNYEGLVPAFKRAFLGLNRGHRQILGLAKPPAEVSYLAWREKIRCDSDETLTWTLSD